MIEDVYKTIEKPSHETLFKEKSSKFFGYAFPISSEEDVKIILEDLKKQHHTANHLCYAYQLGFPEKRFRVSDDGEPSNSAGIPIYGQIQAFDVTNILVVSVRYFGGTKLGVGGLMSAYKTSAQLILETSEIVEKTVNEQFKIYFTYEMMNRVSRILKQYDVDVTHQKLEVSCEYTISIRKKDALKIFEIFNEMYPIAIEKLDS